MSKPFYFIVFSYSQVSHVLKIMMRKTLRSCHTFFPVFGISRNATFLSTGQVYICGEIVKMTFVVWHGRSRHP